VGAKYLRNITKILKSASGVLYGRSTAGTGRGEEITFASIPALIGVYTTAQVDSIIGGIEGLTSADIDTLAEINAILTDADLASVSYVDNGLSGKQATLVSGTNIKTVNSTSILGSGDITVGLSGTGSVDNAALRADGTGGATLQSSAWIIADNYTASPNNTVNHASLQATGGTTNVSASIVPKGTGAFCLAVPDGTATGGNARGANAVDLQTSRGAATQVASGSYAICAGINNTANGTSAVAIGNDCTASGLNSQVIGNAASATGSYGVSIGRNTLASNTASVAIGGYNTASGAYAIALGSQAIADRYGQYAFCSNIFAGQGDNQYVRFNLRRKTTDATPTTLMLDGSSTRLTIPSGKILFANILISGIKSDGSAAACYKRKVSIKNVGGTTSLVGSVETIGTDIEDNASTDVTITADNTNDALDISVTGIAAETWRWVAVVEGLEIAYGT